MTHTTQVLSDEQIDALKKGPSQSFRDFARAIESATLKAVSGQEPLPEGWRLIAVNAEFDNLMYWLDRCESKGHLEKCYDLVEPWAAFQYLEHTPPAQPAPVDEREIINGLNAMRNLFKWWLEWDKTPNELGTSLVSIPEKPSRNVTQAWVDLLAKAETHITALQCAQAPQATKGQP